MSAATIARLRDLLAKTADARARQWLVPSDAPNVILMPDREGNEWDGRAIASLQADDFGLYEEDIAHLIVEAVNALPDLLDAIEVSR